MFEFLDLLAHLGQTLQVSIHSFVLSSGCTGIPHHTPGRTIFPGRIPAFEPMIAPFSTRVIAKTNLSADNHVVLDHDTAANARLRRDDDAFADVAVVAHMDHVVEFRAAADARVQRGAIDAGVRAHFDVVFDHDRSDLRKLLITEFVRRSQSRRRRYRRPRGVSRDFRSSLVVQNDIRMKHTVVAYSHILTNSMRTDVGSRRNVGC